MIGQSFQLQRDSSQPLGAERSLYLSESFEDGRVSCGVCNRCVAGDCFHLVDRCAVGAAWQRFFHTAMLVTQGNLQVQNVLPCALESEMSRFDNARVDRANSNFMNFTTVDAKELAIGGCVAIPASHRLEPRMPVRFEAMLFPNFTFKKVGLRMRHRQ